MALGAIVVVLISIFLPPVGVFLVAGCGADLIINLALTLFGYFPGHIHAFYVEYQYYHRRDVIRAGGTLSKDAGGIYSRKVQSGGGEGVPVAVT